MFSFRKIDVFKVSGHHFYHENLLKKRSRNSKAFWIGFLRIFDNFGDFGRLWAYFCPPFARLFRGRISKRKKKRILPALGPPLARPVEQRTNRHAGRKKRPAGLRSLSARNGPGRTLSLSLTRPGPCTQGHAGFSPQSGSIRRAPLRTFCPQ